MIGPALISMGSFSINNYFDTEVDKINKRYNPINDGFPEHFALFFSLFAFSFGSFITILVNFYVFIIAVLFAILSYLYSYRLKQIFLLGNIYIAGAMAIPFIYGIFVDMHMSMSDITIFFIIILSGLAREIHGTIRDKVGDMKARNVKSIPILYGDKIAAIVAFILYVSAILLSYTLIFRFHSIAYIISISIVNAIFIYTSLIFLKNEKKKYKLSRNLSLLSMGLALLIFFIFSLV